MRSFVIDDFGLSLDSAVVEFDIVMSVFEDS